jgi:hypothetical protein
MHEVMAKKKDTLKDLNEFMKNQQPEQDAEENFMDKKPTVLAKVDKIKADVDKLNQLPAASLHESDILILIEKLAKATQLSSRQVIFNVAEKLLEKQQDKDHIDILFENHISFLKYHQLIIDKLNA